MKAGRLDRLACLPFMHDLQGYQEEALDWISRAMDLFPERVTLQGTYGSLLVEADRLDEARPVLEHVRSASRAEHDQGICALYLAIIARRHRQVQEADALAAKALRLCPTADWLKNRWQRELSKDGAVFTG